MPIASAGPGVFALVLRVAEQPISTEIKLADGIEGPFDEIFPSKNIHHHFVGQDQKKGVYAKELLIPAGFRLVSHEHPYDHLSILAVGRAAIEVDGVERYLVGPTAVTIAAGKFHTLRAETDVIWFCIHPTDETDPKKVDEVILEKIR